MKQYQKLSQLNYLLILKYAIGGAAGCLAAVILHLSSSTSAGIIAILSIQNTRRETFSLVAKRILAFFLAVIIALFTFQILGYRILSLGVYLLIFGIVCECFALQTALVSDTVLILHLYAAQSVHPSLILNELLLLLIGTGCGILMNLYMPGSAHKIRIYQRELEEEFRTIFRRISESVISDSGNSCDIYDLTPLKQLLDALERKAYENRGNTLWSDEYYFIKYVEMRRSQENILERLVKDLKLLNAVPSQAYMISDYLKEVSRCFHEYNNAHALLDELSKIKLKMKLEPLPATRDEFENRAVLYQILYRLEELILLKKQFTEKLTEKEIQRFWKGTSQ